MDFSLGMNFRSSYDCAWSNGQISIFFDIICIYIYIYIPSLLPNLCLLGDLLKIVSWDSSPCETPFGRRFLELFPSIEKANPSMCVCVLFIYTYIGGDFKYFLFLPQFG